MKKIKEIFNRVMIAIPGARTPETLEEVQADIVQDSSHISTMKRWAANVGLAAAGMVAIGLFAKTGLILAPAAGVALLWGALQGGIALVKRDLRNNREAEEKMIAAANAAPETPDGPALTAGLGPAFKDKAAVPANENRIRELEKQLEALEIQAEAKRKAKQLGL